MTLKRHVARSTLTHYPYATSSILSFSYRQMDAHPIRGRQNTSDLSKSTYAPYNVVTINFIPGQGSKIINRWLSRKPSEIHNTSAIYATIRTWKLKRCVFSPSPLFPLFYKRGICKKTKHVVFDKIGSLVTCISCYVLPVNLSRKLSPNFYPLFSPPFLSSFVHLKVRIIKGIYLDPVVIFKSIRFTSSSSIILSSLSA